MLDRTLGGKFGIVGVESADAQYGELPVGCVGYEDGPHSPPLLGRGKLKLGAKGDGSPAIDA